MSIIFQYTRYFELRNIIEYEYIMKLDFILLTKLLFLLYCFLLYSNVRKFDAGKNLSNAK